MWDVGRANGCSVNFMAPISGGDQKFRKLIVLRYSNFSHHPNFQPSSALSNINRQPHYDAFSHVPFQPLSTIFTYELDYIKKLIRIRVHQQTNRTTINVLFTNCKFICVFWFRQRNRFPCFTCTPHSLMDRCQVNRNFGLRTVHFRRELLRHWIGFPKQRINRKQITRPPPDASNTALKGRREAFVL